MQGSCFPLIFITILFVAAQARHKTAIAEMLNERLPDSHGNAQALKALSAKIPRRLLRQKAIVTATTALPATTTMISDDSGTNPVDSRNAPEKTSNEVETCTCTCSTGDSHSRSYKFSPIEGPSDSDRSMNAATGSADSKQESRDPKPIPPTGDPKADNSTSSTDMKEDPHDSDSKSESEESKSKARDLKSKNVKNDVNQRNDDKVCVDCYDRSWDPDYNNMVLLPERWDEGSPAKNICAYWTPDPNGYPINQILSQKKLLFTIHGVFNLEPSNVSKCLSQSEFSDKFKAEMFGDEFLSSCKKDNYTCCGSQYREYKKHACSTQNSYETWIGLLDDCIMNFNQDKLYPRVCHFDKDANCNHVSQMWSSKPGRTVGCMPHVPACKEPDSRIPSAEASRR